MLQMKEKIEQSIKKALKSLGVSEPKVALEHPEDLNHGDYATNVALAYAKELKIKPRDLADKVSDFLKKDFCEIYSEVKTGVGMEKIKIEVASAGFINFKLPKSFFTYSIKNINKDREKFGQSDALAGKKIIIEYTDPNPFKELHIGHFMSNSIGEAISRIIESQGAETKRACYQGDVGMHVAKTVWAMGSNSPNAEDTSNPKKMAAYLGKAYAQGSEAYETNEVAKKEITAVNKAIYKRNNPKINANYDLGRKLSLDYFNSVYEKLGTHFDFFFFESDTGEFGKKIVLEFLKKGIFEESEGAIVFKGEKYDPSLHTRVFINSEGLPTYEAKELGLAKMKYDKYPYDLSIVITGNEVNDYFRILLAAMKLIFPDLASKTKHLSHGMLRLPTGKMSSRKGNVITAETLIDQVSQLVRGKIKDRGFDETQASKISDQIAVGALRYSILKQSPGSDIVYDFEKSVSFEGDSGPYLQYSCVRAKSVLEKAKKDGKGEELSEGYQAQENYALERMLYRFPEIVERSAKEFQPHHIATYLIQLASVFNHFYATQKIVGSGAKLPTGASLRSEAPDRSLAPNASVESESSEYRYRVALTKAFSHVMENGLNLLGIEIPQKM
jgi:arginyl-tRNA synthetase